MLKMRRPWGNIPQNFFAGFNVMAIVLEVPSVLLQSPPGNPKIGVWARTVLNQDQFDRMARPAINTVLIPDAQKNDFNSAVPQEDPSFIVTATKELKRLFGPTNAMAHAEFLLSPGDIMTFDTSSSKGFLNGRGLDDDVIDDELNLLSNGAIPSDGVVNDSVFRSQFPYLGAPNPKSTPLVLIPNHKIPNHKPKPKGKQKKASVQAAGQPTGGKFTPAQQHQGKK